jgi:hypothetical protein
MGLMKKFIADSRILPLKEFGDKEDIKLDLVISGPKRLPRKIKKKIKWMAERVSTVEMLNYILGEED